MDNKDALQTPIKPMLLGEFEFLGECIRVRVSITNTSDLTVFDTKLELGRDENKLHFIRCEPEYPENKGKIQIGNINPGASRIIAFYLEPLICENSGTDINCRMIFNDSFERPGCAQMETLKIKVICPVLHTELDVDIGRLKKLTRELQVKDSRVYIFPGELELQDILVSCRNVIELLDVKHLKTFKTTDERSYESWFYGTTKITKKDLLVKCAIHRVTKSIEIQVTGNDPGDITGLLAQIGHDLTIEFEKTGKIQPVYNLHVKDYVIQRSALLDFTDLDGNCSGNIAIENSVIQGSNAASKKSTKRRQSKKDEEEKIRQEEEQKKKTGNLKRKQEDNDLL